MKVRKLSLTDRFVKEIELKILKGEWAIGQKLPPLRELALDMQVSRSVVNAGIVELINKGYLKSLPRKWTEVNSWKREGTLAVLNGIMENNIWDEELLMSLFDSRMLIECESARLAAINRTEEDLAKLKSILSKEKKANNRTLEEIIGCDLLFHHTIAVASGNMVYPLILKSFEKSTFKLMGDFYSQDVHKFVYDKHSELVKAIELKDADSAKIIMRELLAHGEIITRKIREV